MTQRALDEWRGAPCQFPEPSTVVKEMQAILAVLREEAKKGSRNRRDRRPGPEAKQARRASAPVNGSPPATPQGPQTPAVATDGFDAAAVWDEGLESDGEDSESDVGDEGLPTAAFEELRQAPPLPSRLQAGLGWEDGRQQKCAEGHVHFSKWGVVRIHVSSLGDESRVTPFHMCMFATPLPPP